MEKECTLAIANIPLQKWGETFEPTEALKKGTIFQELNKPFFKAEQGESLPVGGEPAKDCSMEQEAREKLLQQIYEIGFVIDDLTLYLDTHETDKAALCMFYEYLTKKEALCKDFAAKFYPLTKSCMTVSCGDCGDFLWLKGPMPWEGACV